MSKKIEIEKRLSNIILGLLAAVALITNGFLIIIALANPLSTHYTINDRYSYICLSLAGTIAYIIALFSTKNRLVISLSILAVELYLFGIIFQLYSLIFVRAG